MKPKEQLTSLELAELMGSNRDIFRRVKGVKDGILKIIWKGGILRMEQVEISQTANLKLDIMELSINCVLAISKVKAKMVALPPFPEMQIKTYSGKVKRVNLDEGRVLKMLKGVLRESDTITYVKMFV